MTKKVLLVDDDTELLSSLVDQFAKDQNIFDTVTAADGMEALNILKQTSISLLVSDLNMPVMDGFVLLAYTSSLYPDIPVIMINDPGEVGAEEIALESGAVAYIEKPVTPLKLLQTIADTFEKQSEGGKLSNVSLEVFIQLFEMEGKTCTIRVFDKESQKTGVLFFKDGELLNARIDEIEGDEAAYEVMSWENITVSISEVCQVDEKIIETDLQAILMEAISRKEEKRSKKQEIPEAGGDIEKDTQDSGTSMPEDEQANIEGGQLSDVSLEMFVELFAMEEKTCIIHVYEKNKDKEGTLYFKQGELLDACTGDQEGNEAAYELLSWDKVSLSIDYNCTCDEKRLDGDLQSLLLEAMRKKDEAGLSEDDFTESAKKLPTDLDNASLAGDHNDNALEAPPLPRVDPQIKNPPVEEAIEETNTAKDSEETNTAKDSNEDKADASDAKDEITAPKDVSTEPRPTEAIDILRMPVSEGLKMLFTRIKKGNKES